ncbi:hypothetical protein KEM56_002557 [Ascosphaera pollenicola]|nr:hypothetical protein KEM56_002557 [Ascosphaera pollenicola]
MEVIRLSKLSPEQSARDDFFKKGGSRIFSFTSDESLETTLEDELQRATGMGLRAKFFNVPESVIQRLLEIDDRRLKFFDINHQLLTLDTLFRPHEATVEMGKRWVETVLAKDGMTNAMVPYGSAQAPSGVRGKKYKTGRMPDGCYCLKPSFLKGTAWRQWPQIVLEVGASETEEDLLADVRHWFQEGGTSVRIVVTMSMTADIFRLCVYTVGDGKSFIHKRGEVVAYRDNSDSDFVVRRGKDINVPFALLFFREPTGEEKDLNFTMEDFHRLQDMLRSDLLEFEAPEEPREEELSPPPSPSLWQGTVLRLGDLPTGKEGLKRKRAMSM